MKDYDQLNLDELDRAFEMAQIAQKAIDTAISGHSVIKFVKRLPVEPLTYPAISKNMKRNRRIITWSLPGRDHKRALKKGCKFHFTMHSDYVSCPSEKKHYAKAKKFNCWSLTCPYCLSNTVLKIGADIEPKILAYRHLHIRQGGEDQEPKHWVVSPPQDWAKEIVTDAREYEKLRKKVSDDLQQCGMEAGAMVFHPWRQKKDRWELGPHFHVIGYGFINTDLFKLDNEGWLIKLVHSEESIRSVRHTIAYLLTHAGIGVLERSDKAAALDRRLYRFFIPDKDTHEDMCIFKGTADYDKFHAFVEDIPYCQDTYDEECPWNLNPDGHDTDIHYSPYLKLFDIDWEEWVKDAYTQKYQSVRRFGRISRDEMKTVTVLSEERPRICPECGSELCTFHGISEDPPEPVRYNHKIPVISFAEHANDMKRLLREKNLDVLHEGNHVMDLVNALPQMFVPDMIPDPDWPD